MTPSGNTTSTGNTRPASNGVDVKALANLARLDVSDEELAKLEKEIPAILEFVKTIQAASAEAPAATPSLINVMREDANPHESGMYTEDLLSAAPARKENHIVVKQVLKRK